MTGVAARVSHSSVNPGGRRLPHGSPRATFRHASSWAIAEAGRLPMTRMISDRSSVARCSHYLPASLSWLRSLTIVVVVDIHLRVISTGPAEALLNDGIQCARAEPVFLEEGLCSFVLVRPHNHVMLVRRGIDQVHGAATFLLECLAEIVGEVCRHGIFQCLWMVTSSVP